MADVLFLPGIIAPAAQRYGPLLGYLTDVRAVTKDLEVYAGDQPPRDYSIVTELQGITAAANADGFDRFHLYGHSGGGACALAYAAAHPERLLSLTVDEPAADFTPEDHADPYWDEIRAAAALPDPGPAFLQLQLRPDVPVPALPEGEPPHWMAKRPAGIHAFVHALQHHRVDADHYRALQIPVLFTHGTLSHPRWLAMRDRLRGLIPDFRVVEFEGLHHLNTSHQAQPEQTAALLRALWAEVPDEREA